MTARSGSPVGAADSYLSVSAAAVSPAARVSSALRIARTATWATVKVLFVVVAVPLIVIFAIASIAAMFGHAGF